MIKQNLFVDFDNTLVNSTQRIAEQYNQKFVNHPDFRPAKWWECTDYEMKSICPLMTHEDKMEFFNSYSFFDGLELINENTYDVMRRLNEKYQLHTLSIGQPRNLGLKALYLEFKLPFINNYILLKNSRCQMNKSIVDARGGIIIDDMPENLSTSSAELKLLFGDEYEWTKSDTYNRYVNWTDIERKLL
jgi:5'(3')-deoxyribonucleotidase